jgi:hypothetical protein
MADTYDSLLNKYTKKIFDDEIKAGNFASWQMYDVLSPSGDEYDHDKVGVSVSTKFDMVMDPPSSNKEIFAKAFPSMSESEIANVMKTYASCRKLVRREIYTEVSSTNDDGSPTKAPAKYIQVDYMTPVAGKGDQYAKMESGTFKPVHKQRMKLGALEGWILLQKVLPSDTDDPAPYVTVNFYKNFDGIIDGKYGEAIKAAYPTSDANKLFSAIGAVKKRQRIEIWKLTAVDSMQGELPGK